MKNITPTELAIRFRFANELLTQCVKDNQAGQESDETVEALRALGWPVMQQVSKSPAAAMIIILQIGTESDKAILQWSASHPQDETLRIPADMPGWIIPRPAVPDIFDNVA